MTDICVTFLDVGQGDCILLTGTGAGAVIVDLPRPQEAKDHLVTKRARKISAVYITHSHRDHVAPLAQVLRFVREWEKIGKIDRIVVPQDLLRNAWERCKKLEKTKSPEFGRLKSVLEEITQFSKSARVDMVHREDGAQNHGAVRVIPLHPRHEFGEKFRGTGGSNENVISLVLRIEHGNFSALLLADLDGDGVTELHDLPDEQVKCTVVKVPHHGAWPPKPAELVGLLERASPELAVISAGSCNKHGHVRPELFDCLVRMQKSSRLRRFLCTQQTRTCSLTRKECERMGDSGLANETPCAGNIEITADQTGKWSIKTETNHPSILASIPRAACRPRTKRKRP